MNLKRIYIISLMMLLTFCASAKNVKVSFGITGGGIATQMLTEPQPSSPMYISGYGGVFATVNPLKKMGIRIGANYSMQGGNYNISSIPVVLSQSYINVPVSLMYHPKSFISFEAGFYQNILMSARLIEQGSTTVEVNPDDGALKYNIGALAGVSFNLSKTVFINLRYCYGLSYSYAMMGTGYKSNAITAGIGVNLIRTTNRAF
jgi:opacity protein-like surface antigen